MAKGVGRYCARPCPLRPSSSSRFSWTGFALAAYNLLMLPFLWTGVWGTWALGWFDTGLPAIVPWAAAAAFIVKELPLDILRWLVIGVILYTSAMMLRAAFADCRGESRPPAEQVERLASFCAMVFPGRYDNADVRLADIGQLAASAGGYRSRSRFLAELTLDPPGKTSELAGPPHLDDDWLTLSTIHSAKGGEWRAVHVLHASDGNIPSDMALGDVDAMAEELRLLYVALTRARDELSVHVPLRYHVNRHGHDDRHLYGQVSRFIEPARHLFEATTTAVDATLDEVVALDGTVGVADEVDALLASLWD